MATLLRKTLLTEDKDASALPIGRRQSVQDALRDLLAKTLELRPATQKLTDLVRILLKRCIEDGRRLAAVAEQTNCH